jgi:integrase
MKPRKSSHIPKYRLHRARNLACVEIDGRLIYLGAYNSPESLERYGRLIAEWRARQSGSLSCQSPHGDPLLVELMAGYLQWAASYYIKDGRPTSEIGCIKAALRELRTYGRMPAAQFGPRALRAVQQQMVEAGRTRTGINKLCGIIKRMFRWGVAQQLLAYDCYGALATLPGQKRGRTAARESDPVLPVDDAAIEATLQYLPHVVADMVRFQRLVGCRPSEVCGLCPCDVDTSGDVWCYAPASHKTEHHGRQRRIYIGPRAQAILRPYLLREKTAYCFRPLDSERKRRAELRERRKTRVQPSQLNRRKKRPKRKPRDHYDRNSYCRAVVRAAAKAGVPKWSPNQLRHAAATEIRRRFGLEAAQAALGHATADVTQIYATRDFELAARVAREAG